MFGEDLSNMLLSLLLLLPLSAPMEDPGIHRLQMNLELLLLQASFLYLDFLFRWLLRKNSRFTFLGFCHFVLLICFSNETFFFFNFSLCGLEPLCIFWFPFQLWNPQNSAFNMGEGTIANTYTCVLALLRKGSNNWGCLKIYQVDQDGLGFLIFLLLPPKGWTHGCPLPSSVCPLVATEARVCVGEASSVPTKLHPSPGCPYLVLFSLLHDCVCCDVQSSHPMSNPRLVSNAVSIK